MIDFFGENVLELGNDVDEVDFNDCPISHMLIKDKIVMKTDANGDPLAYIDHNAADNHIRVMPRVETGGIQTGFVTMYDDA